MAPRTKTRPLDAAHKTTATPQLRPPAQDPPVGARHVADPPWRTVPALPTPPPARSTSPTTNLRLGSHDERPSRRGSFAPPSIPNLPPNPNSPSGPPAPPSPPP